MLRRWLPPTDEGSSILRLLNLLNWQHIQTPTILCGPLHHGVLFFSYHNEPPQPCILSSPWQPLDNDDPVQKCISWRIGMLVQLLSQGGILLEYFPSERRRTVVTALYACLDSMFPLLEAIEMASSPICLRDIYARQLAPEQCRSYVIDSSRTMFISYLMPHIFTDTVPIPDLAYELAGCPLHDPDMELFVNLLRQVCIKREKMRSFLSTLFNALRGDGETNWLSQTIVTIVKTALLGNYPGASAFVDFRFRRQVYNLNHETVLQYIGSCAGERSLVRETELCAAVCLLGTSLCGTFLSSSIDHVPLDQYVLGWESFYRVNQRVMHLLVDFYPHPPPSNLMLDICRFLQPLQRRYQSIFFALHALYPVTLDYITWWPFRSILVERETLDLECAILCQASPLHFRTLQLDFDKTGTLRVPAFLTPFQWNRLLSLSRYIVDRKAFHVIFGSHALFLEQSSRMLKITGRLAPEKTTILYCEKCNTVRFRPVGIHLPASHITLLSDLNFTRLYCIDCDGNSIVPLSMLGTFIRCYLSTKKTRTIVTLALCSACMHICITGFYNHVHGVVCSECQTTVMALTPTLASKQCIACKVLSQRSDRDMLWTMLDHDGHFVTQIWCARCMPSKFSSLSKANLPLLSIDTVRAISNTPYSAPLKYRNY